jgi:hypothetical protein
MPRRNEKGRRVNEIPPRKMQGIDHAPGVAKFAARSKRVQATPRGLRR